ncbi:DNA cytosine methyltransferase [Alphaproteobacteria bacterium]|nr:DNA cytosine methyltransferase [Alphaproteobacteria bacterium]
MGLKGKNNSGKPPVIDIFAGPGGLGEGFTQAGFRVLLSAEKDPIACETLILRKFFHKFRKGKAPDAYYKFLRNEIDLEDLKKLHPRKWKAAAGEVEQVELGSAGGNRRFYEKLDSVLRTVQDFSLIGGPPCQAYSLAGRSRMLGVGSELRAVNDEGKKALQKRLATEFYEDSRHTLYMEYLKILSRYQPSVFVMENVKGMGSAKTDSAAKPGSVFSNICHGLRNPFEATSVETFRGERPKGYRLFSLKMVEASLITAEEIESPDECILHSENYGVPQARHRIIIVGVRSDSEFIPEKLNMIEGAVTVKDAIGDMPALRSGLSKEGDDEASWTKAVLEQAEDTLIGHTSFDDDLKSQIEILRGRNVGLDRGGKFVKSRKRKLKKNLSEWEEVVLDERVVGFVQHETRSHIRSDLLRYLFVSTFGKVFGRSPRLADWEGKLDTIKPDHDNISNIENKLRASAHNDRFKVQVWNKPASTIVSHISKDGHYFIHPDPSQCRSLTVREAARLQTFPDNYFFCGNRTQQYHQVGNAVPVLLAKKIALTLLDTAKK